MLLAILPFFLLPLAFAGNVDIEECVKQVGNPSKKRPTVDSCREDPACPSIFVYEANNDQANNLNMYVFRSHYKLLLDHHWRLNYFYNCIFHQKCLKNKKEHNKRDLLVTDYRE